MVQLYNYIGNAVEITVDASVIIAVVLNEESKTQLVDRTRGAELLSPPTLYWEVGNALTALFKRRRIDLAQARGAIGSLDDIAIRLAEVDLDIAVSLAHEQSIYAYDAYVLECARRYRTPLLSLDGPQREVARKLGIEVLAA
jgi:predicted nucleic acid-binding protein